ncbi:MAG: hypothetical protein DMD82_15555 [Candidatus Rokuibacteriota bacterium]|nr:MAG: hypothetical protein DMD82_15555 [Candidatus Rokubacteria bacterium]
MAEPGRTEMPARGSVQSLSHRVAGGALSTFGATLAGRALAMAQSITVARLLDPYRVGLFAIISYFMRLAGTLCDLGISVAVTKLTAEYSATRPRAVLGVIRRLLGMILGVSLAVGAVLFFGADRFASLYREPSLGVLFRLAALSLVLAVLGGFRAALLLGFQRIHLHAGLSAFSALSMLVLTLALVPRLGLSGIIIASILTECLAWLWAARPLWRVVDRAAHERHDRARAPETSGQPDPAAVVSAPVVLGRVFHIAAPTFLNDLTLFGAAWFVRTYLAHLQGYEAVGLYQIADSVSRTLMAVSGAIAIPLVPAIAELDATDSGRVGGGLETVLRCTLFVTLPGTIFLALAAQPLLALVFGHAYAAAGTITAWLALATLFQSLAHVFWSAQVGTGRIWTGFGIAATGQGVLVLGTLVSAPSWGLTGLGISVTVAQAVTLGLAARNVMARLHMSLRGIAPLAPAAVFGWAAVAVLFWAGADGVTGAILLSTGVVLWQALRLRPTERRLVREMAASFGVRRA